MNKTLLSLAFGMSLTISGVAADAARDPKPLLEAVQAAIEKAVGAQASDRILAGYGFDDDSPVWNAHSFRAGGIECPESISDVKQATELVMANLKSTFTNRLASTDIRVSELGGDTVLLVQVIGWSMDQQTPKSKESYNGVLYCKILLFKRSRSRVVIIPDYFVPVGRG